MLAMHDNVGLVLNDPFDDFSFFKLHCFGDGCGEVDVELIGRLLPFDEYSGAHILNCYAGTTGGLYY